ncbi:MAG: hypothetical protein AAGH83_03055 [Pseudomonadota bacterium]
MRRATRYLLLPLTLALALAGFAQADDADQSDKVEFLFVMSGGSGEADGDTIVLHDVPVIVYFSDRPERKAGHVPISKFLQLWNDPEGFGADSPNAVLSVFDIDGPQNIVVEVLGIAAAGDTARLSVQVLDGEMPSADFGTASVFFDPISGNAENGVGL